jgi:hypothetical protein
MRHPMDRLVSLFYYNYGPFVKLQEEEAQRQCLLRFVSVSFCSVVVAPHLLLIIRRITEIAVVAVPRWYLSCCFIVMLAFIFMCNTSSVVMLTNLSRPKEMQWGRNCLSPRFSTKFAPVDVTDAASWLMSFHII